MPLHRSLTLPKSPFVESLSLSLTAMPIIKRKLLMNKVSVNIGCSCRKSKLCNIFNPKSKPKNPTYKKHINYQSSSTSTSWEKDNTPNTVSPFDYTENDVKGSRTVRGFGKIEGESVAVEKESDDPYLDFRQSMLQMILENEIYSKDDLRELLTCFLQLNSPYHHGNIVRAFTEIWNGVFSVKSSSLA